MGISPVPCASSLLRYPPMSSTQFSFCAAMSFLLAFAPACGFCADEATGNDLTQVIDDQIAKSWTELSVTAAPVCSDETFVRRAYLNLAGRIPTPQQRRAFLVDEAADKRSRLVDSLLQSDGFARRFADVFDALLMGRGSEKKYKQRQNSQWNAYLRRVFRENRPWDEVVAEILTARPKSGDDRGSVWFLYERNDEHQQIAEAVAPAFFGIRIECAQCHDHMVATEIEQAHYWGLVAFFNRSSNVKSPNGPRVGESAIGGFSEFAGLDGDSHPNLLTFFRSPTVDEQRPSKDEKQTDDSGLYAPAVMKGDPQVPLFSRRDKFVSDVVANHPLIARAFVNRVWAILLGRGIVHPFDEMDSVHPPSHPELLDLLASDFEDSGYDIQRLVAQIARSKVYGLSSVPPEGVDDPATFAWFLPRSLTAEQYAASVEVALRGRANYDERLLGPTRQTMKSVLPEQEVTTISESLFLSNNAALNDYISDFGAEEDLLQQLVNSNDNSERIRKLTLAIFGRLPTDDERKTLTKYLNRDDRAASESLQHIAWSMLTSAEFRFNH